MKIFILCTVSFHSHRSPVVRDIAWNTPRHIINDTLYHVVFADEEQVAKLMLEGVNVLYESEISASESAPVK